MRKLVSVISLVTCQFLYPQYGQEGAIVVAAEGVIRATELTQYNKIAKIQNDILTYQGLVMVMTRELTRIEQLTLDSEKKVNVWLRNLNSVIEIGLKAQRLLELQVEINGAVAETPTLAPFITEAMAGMVQESIVIVTDYGIALKEGKENLMAPKDRIDILNITTAGLDHLISRSAKILLLTKQLANLSKLEDIEANIPTFDLRRPTEDIIGDIENLIN